MNLNKRIIDVFSLTLDKSLLKSGIEGGKIGGRGAATADELEEAERDRQCTDSEEQERQMSKHIPICRTSQKI